MVLRAYPEELLSNNNNDIDISKLTEEIKQLRRKIESLSYNNNSSYNNSDDTLIIIIAFILALLIFVFILYVLRVWRR